LAGESVAGGGTVRVRRGIDTPAWGLRVGIRRLGSKDGGPAVFLGVRAPGAQEPEAFMLGVGETAQVGEHVFAVREIAEDHVVLESLRSPAQAPESPEPPR
jgi:hypothetical protein